MVDLIHKYNNKIQRKIGEIKVSKSSVLAEQYKLEESIASNTYQVGLGMDETVHKQYVLGLISHFEGQNREMVEMVSLKNKLNNNQVKLEIYREIIENRTSSAGEGKEDTLRASTHTATFGQGEGRERAEEGQGERLEQQLLALGEQSRRLETDLKNVGMRTQMLEKEAKKQREWIRGKTEERLDQKIMDLEG